MYQQIVLTINVLLIVAFLILQLFKRRNVATVEDDGIPEDDGMADSGYLESQANNMDPLMVRGERIAKAVVIIKDHLYPSSFTAKKNHNYLFLTNLYIFLCKG